MCLWEGNTIQMTRGMASREQKMLYCWQIFQEVPPAFLEQMVIRYQTKIWKYLTLYISYSPPPPSSPFIAQLTPHHRWAVPGIHFPDVANNSFGMVSQCRGWREGRGKRKRGETRSDLYKAWGCVQQDIPSYLLCYMAFSL